MAEADRLHDLRDRLRATQEAADRLADEARAAAGQQRRRPPAAGWDVPRAAEESGAELEALVAALTALRDALPPELRAQLADLARRLLLFVRAVLDWWIARLESPGAPPAAPPEEPEDIPLV